MVRHLGIAKNGMIVEDIPARIFRGGEDMADPIIYHRLTRSLKVTIWMADQNGNEHEYKTEIWEAGTPLLGDFRGNVFEVYLDWDGNGMVYLPADAVVPIPAKEDGMPDMSREDWDNLRED